MTDVFEPGYWPVSCEFVKLIGGIIKPVFGVLVGGIIGVVTVRYLILTDFEVFAWRLFWETLGNSDRVGFPPDVVLRSTTFWKSVAGLVVGAGVCVWLIADKKTASRTRKPTE